MGNTAANDMCQQVIEFEVDEETTGFFTLIQEDTRIVGAPAYIKFAFAVYGPCGDQDIPAKEVLRSPLWPVRELVEEVSEARPLLPGRYIVAIFTPDKVPNRPLTVLIQLCKGLKKSSG